MSNKFILELDLGTDSVSLPNPYKNENLKVNIFGKDLTLQILEMTDEINSPSFDDYTGPFGIKVRVDRVTNHKVKIVAYAEDIKAKELEEARKEVNDTKEAHKRAQQKLSKLLEG